MTKEMGNVALKSGQTMQIVRVDAPDPDWEQPVLDFLQHKGEPWVEANRLVLERQLEGIQTYFYLAMSGEEIVGNIMTIEAVEAGVAILGHVFTAPQHRRQGICWAIMEVLTRDFVGRGGRGMTLSTGYDGPAYHIYRHFGFRGVGETGKMTWEAESGFLGNSFTPGPTEVREIHWPDWCLLDLLYKIESGSFLRGAYYTHCGPSSYENCFVRFYNLIQEPPSQSKVLTKSGGEVVGHAVLLPDPRWKKDVLLLDLFVHPHFYDARAELLEAIELPPGIKVQAYADSRSPQKVDLLKQLGFEQEAVLPGQLRDAEGEPLDVIILSTVG